MFLSLLAHTNPGDNIDHRLGMTRFFPPSLSLPGNKLSYNLFSSSMPIIRPGIDQLGQDF